MLDIKFVRENSDIIKAGANKKHIDININHLLEVDEDRRRLRQQLDEKRAEQNRKIGRASCRERV